jgi:hypothetical protein
MLEGDNIWSRERPEEDRLIREEIRIGHNEMGRDLIRIN